MFGKHEIDQEIDQIQNINGVHIAMPSFWLNATFCNSIIA